MFEETRPYYDEEIPAAIARVANHPLFETIVHNIAPDADIEEYRQDFLRIRTIREFQTRVMFQAINSILQRTSDGLTHAGFDTLDPDKQYMFVANHRDILLDAAILQVLLHEHHLDTSEITFGSNLMQGGLVTDIGKMNKMFRIVRGGTAHDFYRNSMEVSSYMRYALTQKRQSVWIAQRNGRTKDGSDRTESAELKMFSISSSLPFADNLNELSITPVAISYEYEPCDIAKTQELFIAQYQPYIKEPGEDLRSIIQGIMQHKGHIHLAVMPTITREELDECARQEKNARFSALATTIDQRIRDGYHLWPNNYIAYDLLHHCNRFADRYNPEERNRFIDYMMQGLQQLQGEEDELHNIFLGIYANPVVFKQG